MGFSCQQLSRISNVRTIFSKHVFWIQLLFLPNILVGFPVWHKPQQSDARSKIEKLRHFQPGKPIEETITGGETHSYQITLGAGQFLHVAVAQRGIDVAVRLYDARARKLVEVDTPNGAWGHEPLFFVAEVGGNYRLEISQLERDASAGVYRVLIKELRPAVQQDRNRVIAQQTYGEGDELRAQGTAESVQSAFKKYEKALQFYRAVGDRRGEAASLHYMGVTNQLLSENKRAIGFYDQARPLWHAVGELTAEAITAINTGLAYDDLGEKQRAVQTYNLSLPLFRAVGDRREEANTLSNIGKAYLSLGEYQKALDYFNHALTFFRASGKQRETAYVLTNIGATYENLGEYHKAIHFSDEALQLLRKAGDHRAEGSALISVANIHFGLGRFQQALDLYNQALPLLRNAGNRLDEAQTLNDIGKCFLLLGEKERALDFLAQALELSRSLGDRYREAYTLNNLGIVHAESGDGRNAQESYDKALLLARAVRDLHGEALTLNNLGNFYGSSGERLKALEVLGQALTINRILKERADEANTLANFMFAWKGFHRPTIAISYGKQAVNIFQEIRADIRKLDRELQASFLTSKERIYRELADLLISEGRLSEAQQVLRLLKEEEYFEFIRRDRKESSGLTGAADLTPKEAEWERRHSEIIDKLIIRSKERSELLAKKARTSEDERRLLQLDSDLSIAQADFQRFLDELTKDLRESGSSRVALNLRETEGLMEDLRELGTGVVAIYTLVGDEKYSVILLTPDIQKGYEYPIKASDLNRKIAAFREALENPEIDPLPAAQDLYEILLGPLAKDLNALNPKTVMWSLDGVLRYVPVSALHDGEKYLIERYANVVFTPASMTRLKDVPSIKWRGLGLGVSKAHGDFEALPAVPEELNGIIREQRASRDREGVLPGKVMLDSAFTEREMRVSLRQRYPLVHVASHFQFSPVDESDSFLLLGDGAHFSIEQIKNSVNLFSGVELLTLSACHTAMGGEGSDGKEVEGFGMLAQRKGAKAVIASLWSVADRSTQILMQEFYRLRESRTGMSKSEALQRAQIELLRGMNVQAAKNSREGPRGLVLNKESDSRSATTARTSTHYSHPFYWAPFILIGNWK